MKKPLHNFAQRSLNFFLVSSLFLSTAIYSESQVINLKSILPNIEIADNDSSRRRGLMFRSSLQANTGMIFIWQDYMPRCMWMKNTKMPLSIAFLSKEKEILEIYDMVPMSKASVCSKKNSAYA